MTEQRFTDTAWFDALRTTADGYVMAEARVARTGCQVYAGAELGLTDVETVTVYRPERAVFAKDSLATFAGKPVTMGHPPHLVTADTWKEDAVGDIGDEITRDGEYVKVPFRLMDAKAIEAVRNGTREISMGYTTPLSMEDGVAPDGTPYQAVQTGPIRINHLAIVPKGRAGSECRIGDADARWGAFPITPSDRKDATMADAVKTRTVLIDGLSVETTDAGAQALEKLTKAIADKDKAITDAQAAHDEAVAAKDAELANKDAEIEMLKGSQMTDADLDKRVEDRAALVATAGKIAKDVATKGLSDAAIRKAVVAAKGVDVADKSDAYIEARFDALAENVKPADPVADALSKGTVPTGDERGKAYADALNATKSAWKREGQEA